MKSSVGLIFCTEFEKRLAGLLFSLPCLKFFSCLFNQLLMPLWVMWARPGSCCVLQVRGENREKVHVQGDHISNICMAVSRGCKFTLPLGCTVQTKKCLPHYLLTLYPVQSQHVQIVPRPNKLSTKSTEKPSLYRDLRSYKLYWKCIVKTHMASETQSVLSNCIQSVPLAHK